MFRILPTLLTIATMLAHAVLGCCWHAESECAHHGNAACCAGETETTARHEHDDHGNGCASHGHRHHDASSSVPADERPEPAAPVCTHGKCVYVLADAVTAVTIDDSASFGTLPLVTTELGTWIASGFKEAPRWVDRAASPPLRARAQLQVWLV